MKETISDWITKPGLVKSPAVFALQTAVSWSHVEAGIKAVCLVLTLIILALQAYNALINTFGKKKGKHHAK